MPPFYFKHQQCLWNIALQPSVGRSADKLINVVQLLTARGKIVKQDYWVTIGAGNGLRMSGKPLLLAVPS